MPYESRLVRHMDGRKSKSKEAIMYDAEEHWHLRLPSGEWPIEDIGERVWLTSLYICKREGGASSIGVRERSRVDGKWRGVSLEYRYLTSMGTYVRNRWVSPFGLWGSLMWRSKQERSGEKPDGNDKGDIRLAREAVGNGAGNPSIIATETLARKAVAQDSEEQLEE